MADREGVAGREPVDNTEGTHSFLLADLFKPIWINGEKLDPLVEMGIKPVSEVEPRCHDSRGLFQTIPGNWGRKNMR